MKRPILRLIFAVAVIAAIIGAYLRGQNDFLKTEYKECQAHLTELTYWETNQPAELKDYIKARYYYLANRIPKDWVGTPHDYGPIETNIQHIAVFKGPSSGQLEYIDFLKRFNLLQK